VRYRRLEVEFKDGLKENWALRPGPKWWRKQNIPPSGWFKSDVKITNSYESNLFDEEWNKFIKPHFLLSRKSIVNSGFCDVRLKIHSIIMSLLEEGWIDIVHPDDAVMEDFKNVKGANKKPFVLTVHWVKHYSLTTVPPGYRIITQCSDWGDLTNDNLSLRNGWKDAKTLYYAIDKLIKKKKVVSRDNITRKMISTGKAGVRFANPCFYAALLNTYFKIKNPIVLDASPDVGSKAIGVKSVGGTYNYIDNNPMFAAKMSKYVGDLDIDDGETGVDLIFMNDIYDRTLNWVDRLKDFRDRGDIIVAFVRRENIDKVKADKIVRCSIRPGIVDYMAVYRS
jgi:hypothetical protein